MKKHCVKCKEDKNIEEFNKNSDRKDGLQRLCKECTRIEHKKFWKKNGKNRIAQRIERNIIFRNKVRLLKEERKCEKCGENRWWVLDFHHKDSKLKKFDISAGIISYSQKTVLIEIEKCIILCRNCHSDFHYLERKSNITIEKYLHESR